MKNPTTVAKIALSLVGIVASVFIGYSVASADTAYTAGPKSPSVIVSDTSSGGIAWSNPQNAANTDLSVAVVSSSLSNSQNKSGLLRATGFDFSSIPDRATITGVSVTVVKRGGSFHRNKDNTVVLVSGETVSVNNNNNDWWSILPFSEKYGGSSDLWGMTLTPSMVKSSSFGLALAVQHGGNGSSKPEVDSIRLSVSYTVPPDTVPPVISGTPSDILVEINHIPGILGTHVTYVAPTAVDDVDGAVAVTCNPASGSLFLLIEKQVTCTAKDLAGNIATTNFNVTVILVPEVSITPETQTVEATSAMGATAEFVASAKGYFNNDITPTCDQVSGSMFGFGATTVTCTAKGLIGSTGSATAIIVVQDTTAPAVVLTGEANIALHIGDTYEELGATATDTVDGTLVPVAGGDTVDTSKVGTYTIVYTATDAHGNTGTMSRTVSVSDVEAPIIAEQENLIVEATNPRGAYVEFDVPSAQDDADGEVEVSCDPASGSLFEMGDTTITCSAIDSSENKATSAFIVTVEDTTAPIVEISAPIDAIEATDPRGAIVDFRSFASDFARIFAKAKIVSEGDGIFPPSNDDSDYSGLETSCTPESGSWFSLGTTTITCLATDTSKNTGSSTVEILVVDTIAPAIIAPADQIFEATGATTTPELLFATSTDAVDVSPAITHDINDFAVGTTTVTWTATDFSSNFASATSLVTITDTKAPIITLNGDVSMTFAYGATFADEGATATDIVDGDVKVVVSGSVNTSTAGTYILTYDATDVAGNKAEQKTRTVVVSEAPVQRGGGNGGGGGVVSGPLSFGYTAPIPPVPPPPPALQGQDEPEGNNDGDEGQGNGLQGDQMAANGGEQQAGGDGAPMAMLNGFQGAGAQGTGNVEGDGTPADEVDGAPTDNNQAAAVGGAVSGFYFPVWAWVLIALAILGGFGAWFFFYRRKNA